MEDTNSSTEIYSEAKFSDSVPMEIQLRSQLRPYVNSQGWWVALLGTHTPGDTAIPQLNLSVWPASIRSTIRKRLVQMGGVPLESPLTITIDKEGKLSVQPAKKPDNSSTVTTVEPATEDDVPKLSLISSSKLTEQRPDDTSKKCQQHDWHTNGLGVTYCWNCQVQKPAS